MLYTEVMAEVVRRLLRIPPDVDAALCEWAAEEDRSVNSLMVHLLRLAIRERKAT